MLATINRREPTEPIEVPANAVLTDWLPYSQVMPQADLVISHGGHGTVVRALHSGAPVLCCPAGGDMGENGARVVMGGRGAVAAAEARVAAGSQGRDAEGARRPGLPEQGAEIAAWSAANDGAERASELVEEVATTRSSSL